MGRARRGHMLEGLAPLAPTARLSRCSPPGARRGSGRQARSSTVHGPPRFDRVRRSRRAGTRGQDSPHRPEGAGRAPQGLVMPKRRLERASGGTDRPPDRDGGSERHLLRSISAHAAGVRWRRRRLQHVTVVVRTRVRSPQSADVCEIRASIWEGVGRGRTAGRVRLDRARPWSTLRRRPPAWLRGGVRDCGRSPRPRIDDRGSRLGTLECRPRAHRALSGRPQVASLRARGARVRLSRPEARS